jgi:hypothetical protein
LFTRWQLAHLRNKPDDSWAIRRTNGFKRKPFAFSTKVFILMAELQANGLQLSFGVSIQLKDMGSLKVAKMIC